MLVSEFEFDLPRELIAQHPVEPRDASRLLVLERWTGNIADRRFNEIVDYLHAGDLLVLNNTRVVPARIFGVTTSGGRIELLLLRRLDCTSWEVLARPARKVKTGSTFVVGSHRVFVEELRNDGIRIIRFEPAEGVESLLERSGELALPPYISEPCSDPGRYQTVYAERPGAVAAPTAGLHFTSDLLERIRELGVELAFVTLHAGLGTFRPVVATSVEGHSMHPEEFELGEEAAASVNRALSDGRRVICVGTTTVRVLEGQARRNGSGWQVEPGRGETSLYIYPGYEWKVCGALVTNFHLPRSTLLMLVAAYAGLDRVLAAYRHAIEQRYRFYSFGDAMLII